MSQGEFMGALVVSMVSLSALFTTIAAPMIKNTKAMTQLTCAITELKNNISALALQTKEQEKAINDHEVRIALLENNVGGENDD